MRLEEFLVKAKINTYASGGEGGEKKLEDGSRELIYEKAKYKYRDRYFGFNSFIGEEVVWENGNAIWAMNYYGMIILDSISPKEVYEFLKKAMQQVKEERPFRGPSKFQEGDFLYIDENDGLVENFTGVERIYFKNEKVYELKYHGGVVKK